MFCLFVCLFVCFSRGKGTFQNNLDNVEDKSHAKSPAAMSRVSTLCIVREKRI